MRAAFLHSLLTLLALALLSSGCGPNYQAQVMNLRQALDRGDLEAALQATNGALGVDDSSQSPSKQDELTPLLLLERGVLLQAKGDYALSARDLSEADQGLEIIDLSQSDAKVIAEYLFSDAAGNYQTPPYEKVLINTLNMVNYLAIDDLQGALVEARRLAVLDQYFDSQGELGAPFGVAALVAGFVHEQAGELDDAIIWYESALDHGQGAQARKRLAALAEQRPSDERAQEARAQFPGARRPAKGEADVLVLTLSGRAPYWVESRLPIGAAVAVSQHGLSPEERRRAEEIAVKGLFKWINYPQMILANEDPFYPFAPKINGQAVELELALDVEEYALSYYYSIKTQLIVAAITRLLSRTVVSELGEAAVSGNGKSAGQSAAGFLIGRAIEGAMVVADTPDTRSWNSLPAGWSLGFARVPAGEVELKTRQGHRRSLDLSNKRYGVVVINELAL